MLLIVFRLVETGLEVEIERHRTLTVTTERINVETGIGTDSDIIDFFPEESVIAVGVPMEEVVHLALGAAVEIHRVPDCVAAAFQIAVRRKHVVIKESVSYSHVQ